MNWTKLSQLSQQKKPVSNSTKKTPTAIPQKNDRPRNLSATFLQPPKILKQRNLGTPQLKTTAPKLPHLKHKPKVK